MLLYLSLSDEQEKFFPHLYNRFKKKSIKDIKLESISLEKSIIIQQLVATEAMGEDPNLRGQFKINFARGLIQHIERTT